MIKLISYATGDFQASQRILSASALKHGADVVSSWGRDDLVQTSFYRAHRDLLDAERGAGFWIWKPYVILEELRSLAEGDVLIYSDPGRPGAPLRVDSPLEVLADWTVEHAGGMLPGVYIPEYGFNENWTKGECFKVMDCDSQAYRTHPQIQATFSVWQRHQQSIDFVSRWLEWCTVPSAITEEPVDPSIPDAPGFVLHRYDQSVLTLLALKEGLRCYGRPDEVTPVSKHLSSLIDRIAGRTWSMRRRIAQEDRRPRNQHMPGKAIVRPVRQAKRFAASWVKAVRTYP